MSIEHIYENDSLNTGRKKINDAIDASDRADRNASEAVTVANDKGDKAVETAERAEQKSDSTQQQLDNIVIESGTSDAEVIQARGDFGLLYQRLNNYDGRLSRISIDIISYNPPLINNTYDLSEIFEQACNDALTSGACLKLPKGKYLLNLNKSVRVPCIDGDNSILTISGNYSLLLENNFKLENISIVTSNTTLSTNPTLKQPLLRSIGEVKKVELYNIEVDIGSENDGVLRAYCFINLEKVEGLSISNVRVNGFRYGFYIARGSSNDIKGDRLVFTNTETAIYISGSNPLSGVKEYAHDIVFENVKHVNTNDQSNYYMHVEGADTFMLEKCKKIKIRNIYVENVVERAIYAHTVQDSIFENIEVLDNKANGAIKIVGDVRYDEGYENYSENVTVRDAIYTNKTVEDGYMFDLYFIKNLKIDSAYMYGGGFSSQMFTANWFIDGLSVSNSFVTGLKRFVIEYSTGGRTGNPETGVKPNPIENFPSSYCNVDFKNFKAENICMSHSYYAFEVKDSIDYDIVTIENISLENVLIKNQKEQFGRFVYNGEHADSLCRGLIKILKVNGLYIKNTFVQGHAPFPLSDPYIFPFQVGMNSENVYIDYLEPITLDQPIQKFTFNNLYVSPGSSLKFRLEYKDKLMVDEGEVKVHPGGGVRRAATKYIVDGTIRYRSEGNEEFYIWGSSSEPFSPAVGVINVSTSEGDRGEFIYDKNYNLTLKYGDSNVFSTVSESGKLSVIKKESSISLRDRRNITSTLLVNYSITSF